MDPIQPFEYIWVVALSDGCFVFEVGQIQCVKCWLLCVHVACWIPPHFGLAWSSSTSTPAPCLPPSTPMWVADRVGCGNGVKILPSTGVRCELLSENFLVFKLCFSLCLSLFFSILFPCPLKNQLKHHVLCCSMFLYFSLGTWWWVANSALFCFMFLYFSWHLGRHMYFLASIWLQLLKCSGLARTLYPVSSWEGDSTWCFHMWQCLKTCEKLWNKWTAFDSTCTGQDLIELDTW